MDEVDHGVVESGSSLSETEDQTKDPEALRHLTESCQALFQECQRQPALSDNDWIDKMSANFNWWSMGISATKSGHSSLDYRVQARDDVRSVLISLLGSLVVSLKNYLSIVKTHQVDLDEAHHKKSQGKEKQRATSVITIAQPQLPNEDDSALDEQVYYIKETLQTLSKISMAMRKSGTKFRHQRVDKHFDERAHELEEFRNYLTHLILMSPLKMQLLDSVICRYTQPEELIWKKVWMTLRAYFTDAQRLSPVQERLLRANLVRRNRFNYYFNKYCQKIKAGKGSRGTPTTKQTAQTITTAVSNPIRDNLSASIQVRDPVSEAKLRNMHGLPERPTTDDGSGVSSQQTATEIGSFVIPQRTRTHGTRSVSTKFSQGVLKQDYPKCPHAEGESFWCPYCAQALDSSYANQQKNKRWRGHVAEDLSPYVCVYADCDKPDAMYITTDEWKKHLRDSHRVPRWICDTCWLESDDPNEFQFELEEWCDHMATKHNGEYDDDDLPELLEASCREILPPVPCPLCFGNTPLLQPDTDSHIAEHLHAFALQALPWEAVGPDDDTRASVGSNVRKTVPSDDSNELLDEEGNWEEVYHLPDLISATLTCCTNMAERRDVASIRTLNVKLTDLAKTLQDLPQDYTSYSSKVGPEITICLRHLELILQRHTDTGDYIINPQTLEILEADIDAGLTSLNTLVELERRSTDDLPAPDRETPPSTNSVRDELVESANKTSLTSDLWSQAIQDLDEKAQKSILEYELKAQDGKLWATDLIALVRERQEAYNDSPPKLEVEGFKIIWRDYANKTVALLAAIGNMAVQFSFSVPPIFCSALRVFIQTEVTQYEYLAAVFGCAYKALSLMRRGAVYEMVYLQDASSNTAARGLQKTLVDLYRAVLQLLMYMPIQSNERRGRELLQALVCPGEGSELVSNLNSCEHELSRAVQAFSVTGSMQHKSLLQSLSAPLRLSDENLEHFVEHFEEQNLYESLGYISEVPTKANHLEKTRRRALGTCEWLLKHPLFIQWEESSCSSILWLQGDTGTGKSCLTSKVIDRYFDDEYQVTHDEGFAYFYCSRFDPARRGLKSIYQSFIRQLAQVKRYPTGIHKSVSDLCSKVKKEQREPSIDECQAVMSELLNSYPQTILIIDAFDECDLDDRDIFHLYLHSLLRNAERPVKLFITSRKARLNMRLRFRNTAEIKNINQSIYHRKDIEHYIEQEMTRRTGPWQFISREVKDDAKRTIADRSNGIFMLASLQWYQINKFTTGNDILEQLWELPRSLEQAYDKIYHQNNKSNLIILQGAVKWVLCAQVPLSNDQFLSAIRLEVMRDSNTEAALTSSISITQSSLESICRNLLVRDDWSGVWKFSHSSVAQYFETIHKDWTIEAHEDAAALLISCLIDGYSRWITPPTTEFFNLWLSESKPDPEDYLDIRHPLQYYARRFWVQHARSSLNHSRLSPILKRFLGSEGPQRSSSRQYRLWCHHIRHNPGLIPTLTAADLFPVQKSIFGICVLGLDNLLEDWWDKDIDVLQVNRSGMNLTSIATKYCHRKLFLRLMNHKRGIPHRIE